jgi:hypothetical protein
MMCLIKDKQGDSTHPDKPMNECIEQNPGSGDHDLDILQHCVPDGGRAPVLDIVGSANQSALICWHLLGQVFVLLLSENYGRG